MSKLNKYEVNTQAFAGTSQRREEILLPVSSALLALCKSGEAESVSLAQLALYKSAAIAALKGRSDKSLVDLAKATARLPRTQLGLIAMKILEANKTASTKEITAKIAAKLSATARHFIALDSDGFSPEVLGKVSSVDALESRLQELENLEELEKLDEKE